MVFLSYGGWSGGGVGLRDGWLYDISTLMCERPGLKYLTSRHFGEMGKGGKGEVRRLPPWEEGGVGGLVI